MIARNNFNKNKIYELRLKSGMNLIDFGKFVGCSITSISFWERGIFRPSVRTLKKIADAFNVEVEYFFN